MNNSNNNTAKFLFFTSLMLEQVYNSKTGNWVYPEQDNITEIEYNTAIEACMAYEKALAEHKAKGAESKIDSLEILPITITEDGGKMLGNPIKSFYN